MPSATSTTQPRGDLGLAVEEFDMSAEGRKFIADRVYTPIPVAMQAGYFGRVTLKQLMKEGNVKRVSQGDYNRITYEIEDDSYATKEYGLEGPLDERFSNMYPHYRLEQITVGMLRRNIKIAAEKRVANAVFNATTYSAQKTTITHEWDDAANAVPINDILTAKQAIRLRSGQDANTLIINQAVFENLRNCDQIVDRIAGQGAGAPTTPTDITAEWLARCFDIERVLVAGAMYDSANEGQALSGAYVWSSEYAMLCKVDTSDNFMIPCIGRTLVWDQDGAGYEGVVETYEENRSRGMIYRVRHDVVEKDLVNEVCQLFDNVTTI